jgi:tetratricopeptide (TPR) repeat protein
MINFTTDSVHILESLDTKVRIAHRENNTKKLLEAVSEAQTPGRITSAEEELNWLSHEAIAIANTGDYSRALGLIGQVNEQLVAAGLMGSDKHLGVIDLQGAIHLEKQEYIEARKFYAVVISKTSPNHSPLYHAHALAYIAYIDILTEGSDAEIVRNLSAAEAVYAALGNPQESPCSWITSELYMYRGDLENARSGFEQCVFTSPYKRLVIHSSATLADPRHKMHDRSHTFCWAVVYLCLVLTSKDRAGTFQALRRLADIFVLFDEEDTALNLYDATLEGATEMDIHCLRAECMAGIADIMFRRGDSVQAKEMWEAAHTLFIRSSQMKDAAAVRARIDELQSAERVNQEPLSILNGGSASEFVSDNTDGDTDKCGAMDKLSILSAPLGLPPVENDVPPQSTTEHDSPGTQGKPTG